MELGPGITMATIRLYIEKVSPFNNDAYSKNVFLNRLIEEFYKDIELKKVKKHGDIEKMKKHIEGLEEIAELEEQFGAEGVEENLMEEEKANYRPKKSKLIELVSTAKKIQNLKGVVSSQSRMLHANTTTIPFVPSSKHIDVDSKLSGLITTLEIANDLILNFTCY